MIRALRLGGYLHDLGKIGVPDGILLKPGPLDAAERARIRLHPGAGADLVLGLKSLEDVRPIMRHHHERWNGTGYPDGLRGEAIPLGARIIAVVDVYDALHTERPYKPALPHAEAIEHPLAGDRGRLLGSARWSTASSARCAVSIRGSLRCSGARRARGAAAAAPGSAGPGSC